MNKTYTVSEKYKSPRYKEEKQAALKPTPDDVDRVDCPVCGSKEFVRPFIQGYIEPDDELFRDMEQGRLSVLFSCLIDEWWEWDCVRCRVRFLLENEKADIA